MASMIFVNGFNIRSKADAVRFLTCGEDGKTTGNNKISAIGCFYWSDGVYDYRLDTDASDVGWRSIEDRGNIFAPYVCVDGVEAVNLIFKQRKHINKEFFSTPLY